MYQTIVTETRDRICTITINRPDKLNALNQQVIAELSRALDAALADDETGAIILTGSGPKAFVAGADISEFSSLDLSEARNLARRGQILFQRFEDSPKPVIAAVNGFALGGGCELAMSCHLRIAAEHARFGQPEVNLGLIPGYGGTQRLPQLIGKGRALEWMLSGNMMDAAEAWRTGLVNHVVPADQLLDKCRELLQVMLGKAPIALARVIEATRYAYYPELQGYEKEADAFASCFQTDDVREGIQAFLEKRKPVFHNR